MPRRSISAGKEVVAEPFEQLPESFDGKLRAPAELSAQWRRLSREQLERTIPGLWILFCPPVRPSPFAPFHTRVAEPESLSVAAVVALRLRFCSSASGLSSRWRLGPIGKRPCSAWRDRVLVGRARDNDVVVPHDSVSKVHAYFERRDGALVLRDAGSKNGIGVAQDSCAELTIELGARLRVGALRAVVIGRPVLIDLMTR